MTLHTIRRKPSIKGYSTKPKVLRRTLVRLTVSYSRQDFRYIQEMAANRQIPLATLMREALSLYVKANKSLPVYAENDGSLTS
jgi:hypothetical protein